MFAFYRRIWEEIRYYVLPTILLVILATIMFAKPLYHCRSWLGPAFCNPILWLTWQDHLILPLPEFGNGDASFFFTMLCVLSFLAHAVTVVASIAGIITLFEWGSRKKRGY